MAEQMRPSSPQQAPDPSTSYERSHPGREPGMGRLDNNKATPRNTPDRQGETVPHRQDPGRQINAHDAVNQRGGPTPEAPEQPDHSMKDEEPLGWDRAPSEATDRKAQRHPRRDGKGGDPVGRLEPPRPTPPVLPGPRCKSRQTPRKAAGTFPAIFSPTGPLPDCARCARQTARAARSLPAR